MLSALYVSPGLLLAHSDLMLMVYGLQEVTDECGSEKERETDGGKCLSRDENKGVKAGAEAKQDARQVMGCKGSPPSCFLLPWPALHHL